MKARAEMCAKVRPERGQNAQHPENSYKCFLNAQILVAFESKKESNIWCCNKRKGRDGMTEWVQHTGYKSNSELYKNMHSWHCFFFCTKKPFFLSIYIQFAFIIHFSLFPTLLVPTLICISAPMLPSSLSATCHQPTDSLQWRTPGRIPEPTPVLALPLPRKTAMNYNIALTLWVARRVPAACRGCSDKSR